MFFSFQPVQTIIFWFWEWRLTTGTWQSPRRLISWTDLFFRSTRFRPQCQSLPRGLQCTGGIVIAQEKNLDGKIPDYRFSVDLSVTDVRAVAQERGNHHANDLILKWLIELLSHLSKFGSIKKKACCGLVASLLQGLGYEKKSHTAATHREMKWCRWWWCFCVIVYWWAKEKRSSSISKEWVK